MNKPPLWFGMSRVLVRISGAILSSHRVLCRLVGGHALQQVVGALQKRRGATQTDIERHVLGLGRQVPEVPSFFFLLLETVRIIVTSNDIVRSLCDTSATFCLIYFVAAPA